jgi:L-ascorbate metabolism protein UlaG (beta-lactamase superfamily)
MSGRRFAFFVFLVAILLCTAAFAAPPATEVTWLGHSAFKIKTPSGKILLIDPWLVNPSNPKGAEVLAGTDKVDLILVTHGHGDHIGNATEIAKKTGAKLVATFDLGKAMVLYGGFPEKQFGFETTGNFGGRIRLLDGEVGVGFVPAVHSSAMDSGEGSTAKGLAFAGNPGGFVIAVKNGPTLYHTGDTDFFSDMESVRKYYGPIDLMLVCIGDRFTMGPDGATRSVKAVRPKTVIPMHYGTFPVLTGTPEAFRTELQNTRATATLKVLSIGEMFRWEKK